MADGLHLTIDAILEEGEFQPEAEEIVKAVAELMKYQTDEPIRAAFRHKYFHCLQ
jgi:hypothetical protein